LLDIKRARLREDDLARLPGVPSRCHLLCLFLPDLLFLHC
jgi:hypothetical protein